PASRPSAASRRPPGRCPGNSGRGNRGSPGVIRSGPAGRAGLRSWFCLQVVVMASTKVSRVIQASRKAIYRALTDPGALATWRVPDDMVGKMHEFDLRPGGRYRMSLTYTAPKGAPGKTTADTDTFEGRFVELVPDEKVIEAIVFEAGDAKFGG